MNSLPIDLNLVWFGLIGFLCSGYIILDGFDLGVGALHLLTKTDEERRIMLNSIGPVWDGNEVWLVTAGGTLFAVFPEAYATLMSGFYLVVFLLLFSLIFRAVAIEFRSKESMLWWRQIWDWCFCISSILISFLLGVVFGNLIWGIPLGPDKEFVGTFFSSIHPYSLVVGITSVVLFMMHGSIYLLLKTGGEIKKKVQKWSKNSIMAFMICYVVLTILTFLFVPHMVERIKGNPILFIIPLINFLAIVNIPRETLLGRYPRAFLSSCIAIMTFIILFGLGIFPNIVLSNPYPEYSLSIYTASSSPKTLQTMLIIAMIGMPFVLGYTICIYRIFRGKVKLDEMSY